MSIYLHMFMVVLHVSEVCLLPQPKQLKVTSLNMGAVLSWDTPQNPPNGLTYTAEIRGLWDFEPGCRGIAEQQCDFGILPSCHGVFSFRVRAELENQTSKWSQTLEFTPAEQTVIGPPGVTLVRTAEGLELTLKDPTMKSSSTLRDCLTGVTYDVKFYKKDHPDDAVVNQRVRKQKVTLRHLDGDTSYCVQARVNSPQLTGQYSDPQCAPETSVKKFSAAAVVSLVVVAVALPLVLVTAWLAHRGAQYFNRRVSLPRLLEMHRWKEPCGSDMLALPSDKQELWDTITCHYEACPDNDGTMRRDDELLLRVENGDGLGEEVAQYCNVTAVGAAYRNIVPF